MSKPFMHKITSICLDCKICGKNSKFAKCEKWNRYKMPRRISQGKQKKLDWYDIK